jgi:hypothetical protein
MDMFEDANGDIEEARAPENHFAVRILCSNSNFDYRAISRPDVRNCSMLPIRGI